MKVSSESEGAPPRGYQGIGIGGVALGRAAAGVTLAAVAGQAPGFFIPLSVATLLGANRETDILFLAFAMSTFALSALTAAAQDAALPFLVANRESGGDRAAYLGQALSAVLVLASILAALLAIAGPQLLSGSGGVPVEYVGLGTSLLWLFVPYVILSGVGALAVGALNAEGAYIQAALSPAIRSCVILLVLFVGSPLVGVSALAYGYVAGELCRAWYLHRSLASIYGQQLTFSWFDWKFLDFFRKAVAQIAGSATLGLIPLLDRFWAATLPTGSVSLLDYAERLWQVPLSFLLSGVLVLILSRWSADVYRSGNIAMLATSTRRTALWLSAMSLPPCLVVLVFRVPIIATLFTSAALTTAEMHTLADTFGVLVLAVPVYVTGLVYARAFLVLKRSNWLLGVAILQVAGKLALNSVLVPLWGVPGIAVATALTFGCGSVVLAVVFGSVARSAALSRDESSSA